MSDKFFDLNIEKILEDWGPPHAIREIIANAIDEQILTKTKDIEINKDQNGDWHIRDFGRGLNYEHLTQNENKEKIENPNIIGKFGIGLKDALATFDRRNIKIVIKSKNGDIRLEKTHKHGFDDIMTLHARISPPSEPTMSGTDVVLSGVTDKEVEEAKNLFLRFSGEKILEKTQYGELLKKNSRIGLIYVNGVKVAEEPNFIFSYNITALNGAIRKVLNRERTNVGRTAYSSRIKHILLSCKDIHVAKILVKDLQEYSSGLMHDELTWIDIQEHAVKILNQEGNHVFLTSTEIMTHGSVVDHAKDMGYGIITIPDNLRDKIHGAQDLEGKPIVDIFQFSDDYSKSFKFRYIESSELNDGEKFVFESIDKIFSLIGGQPKQILDVKISETMRKNFMGDDDVAGAWSDGLIVIRKDQLGSLVDFSGTLLHETAHAISGASDSSRPFEQALSELLGRMTVQALK